MIRGWIVWCKEPGNDAFVEPDSGGEYRIYRTQDRALSWADDLSVTAMQEKYNADYGVARVEA